MSDNPYDIIDGEWNVRAEYRHDGSFLCYDIPNWKGGRFIGLSADFIANINYNIVRLENGVLSGLDDDIEVFIRRYYPPPYNLYLAERIK